MNQAQTSDLISLLRTAIYAERWDHVWALCDPARTQDDALLWDYLEAHMSFDWCIARLEFPKVPDGHTPSQEVLNAFFKTPRRDLRGIKLRNTHLSGQRTNRNPYPSFILPYETIVNIHFAHCDLRRANFEHTNLSRINFQGACLHHANLAHTHLRMTNFSGSDLRHTTFTDSTLNEAIWNSETLWSETNPLP